MTLPADAAHAAIRSLSGYLADWAAYQAEYRGATGVQLAVRHGGELLVDAAWGAANADTGEPLTTSHLFRIASHSKTMTAVIVLRLAERGELRLDDRLGERVPELADSPVGGVTVRELLGHQGGVIRDSSDGDFWQRAFPFPGRDALIALAREEGTVFDPNEHFKYSNIGYGLLGLVIEAVTGKGYGDVAEELITTPLALADTGPEHVPARAGDYAAGHTARHVHGATRRPIEHVDTAALAPATGWYSTARDLSRYGEAHVFGDDTLISDAGKRLMQREESRIRTRGQPERRYGLGIDRETIGEREVVGHSGGYPGHITRTWIDPHDGLVVSALTNDIDGPAGTIATGVVQLIDLALAAAEDAPAAPAAPPVSGRFANLWDVVDLVELGGVPHVIRARAAEPRAAATRLVADGDRLILEAQPGFAEAGEPVVFSRDAHGAVTRVRIGAMTYWPFQTFREAMSSPHPGDVLGRMSL